MIFERYPVRGEGVVLDDDFVAGGTGPVEGDEQQVDVDRQAVHGDDLLRRRPHNFRHGLLHFRIAKSSREFTVEMRQNAPSFINHFDSIANLIQFRFERFERFEGNTFGPRRRGRSGCIHRPSSVSNPVSFRRGRWPPPLRQCHHQLIFSKWTEFRFSQYWISPTCVLMTREITLFST